MWPPNRAARLTDSLHRKVSDFLFGGESEEDVEERIGRADRQRCRRIAPEMAVRLSKAFGPSPEMWVLLQANYDLSQVRQDEIAVARYRRASWTPLPVGPRLPLIIH